MYLTFLRTDLHNAKAFQYIRPEIIGMIFGSFIVSLLIREKFSVHLYPVIYFFGGVFTMIGVLIFLGCTVRVFVRLGGGDQGEREQGRRQRQEHEQASRGTHHPDSGAQRGRGDRHREDLQRVTGDGVRCR